jgi:hypothetical protein
MHLAIGALAKLGLGAAANGAAAGGVAAAAGSTFNAMSILQGAASVAGILGTLTSANAQAKSYETQARTSDMEAQSTHTEGLQRQVTMKRELMRVLGENDVSFAAAGIDTGSGVAAQGRDVANQRATTEMNVDRAGADGKAAMLRLQASGYRNLARSSRQAGVISSFGTLAQTGFDILQRGPK